MSVDVVPNRFFSFQPGATSLQKLRFLAFIDYFASKSPEASVLAALSSCMEDAGSKEWYYTVCTNAPNSGLTLEHVRASLLQDLELLDVTDVLKRYELQVDHNLEPSCLYFQSIDFKLLSTFVEETQGLKEKLAEQEQWINALHDALSMKSSHAQLKVDFDSLSATAAGFRNHLEQLIKIHDDDVEMVQEDHPLDEKETADPADRNKISPPTPPMLKEAASGTPSVSEEAPPELQAFRIMKISYIYKGTDGNQATQWPDCRGFFVTLSKSSSLFQLAEAFIDLLKEEDDVNRALYDSIAEITFYDGVGGPRLTETVWPVVRSQLWDLEAEVDFIGRRNRSSP